MPTWACIDGNEAAARVAYALSEVVAIYPITPASPMGELADDWAAAKRPNRWGIVPDVIEMQSEAGAAGTLHGALQVGALATSFTASQGLLLMIPNMFKIAGELTPCVLHVAARTVATHALSIFGDHQDVMHARTTGWAMLCAGSVQEAHDFALVAHAATLRSRIPFVHFFDGFRTSHEISKIELLDDADIAALVRDDDVVAHRLRGMSPDHPTLRGSAQNPDVFFQAREACNPYYDAVPDIVAQVFAELHQRTGRNYGLVDYTGAADAERVVVMMGSGSGAATEAIETLVERGERVGLLTVRLYRPFPTRALLDALPDTVTSIAVLDRTKEPGSIGEPLYQDVVTTLAEAAMSGDTRFQRMPRVIGGRYGLSSKEFTAAHAIAVFEELRADRPRPHFTVGIYDDVTNLSLPWNADDRYRRPTGEVEAVFFGLGSDGTVGANKNTIKIIGDHTDLHAQGYFVYDSKKSGSVTVSHLRFGPQPIRSTYLIGNAHFVACHQFGLLEKMKVVDVAAPGATFLLNSPYGPDEVWDHLPGEVQEQIVDKQLKFYVIDAIKVAQQAKLGSRINTVMQPCFFQLAGVIPVDEALALIKGGVEKTYGKRGRVLVERNFAAIDAALSELRQVNYPQAVTSTLTRRQPVPDDAPEFVRRVTAMLMAGDGDLVPVSALPVDGVFPTGTSRYEKQQLAQQIPVFDPDVCIDCGRCAAVCPHAAIRMKVYEPAQIDDAPAGFKTKAFRSKDAPGLAMTIQVAPDDCTGCSVCVDVCPAKSKSNVSHKAINMESAALHRDAERPMWDYFLTIPELDRDLLPHDTVKGAQALQPLFEFSGACVGCGETPYLKLVSQLYGDRMVVANATGCSSIYGGNLPTTPWTSNAAGRGPAWANSLFEDNAEFGLGLALGVESHHAQALGLVQRLAGRLDADLVDALCRPVDVTQRAVDDRRSMVERLRVALAPIAADRDDPADRDAAHLLSLADHLVSKSVWIIGGDGWAYDIGFGGLDHVLSSGRNVNVLVLDTEVYSNTGGQASKATQRAAVAKFAGAGKSVAKKDLGAIARAYGNVYVAQVAIGANDVQTTKAFNEAAAWPGPSLIIAYSTCIAHGIDMSTSMTHQRDAVRSGYWPLYRYAPSEAEHGNPFSLDSKPPDIPVRDFIASEARFAVLSRTHPQRAAELGQLLQADVDERYRFYDQLAGVQRTMPHLETPVTIRTTDGAHEVSPSADAPKEAR